MSLDCDHLLIGMTGSIGVVDMHRYLVKLRQIFAKKITVMMSKSAQQFVPAYTMELFSANPVIADSFDIKGEIRVPHIELAEQADLFLIMPATANILGKAAHAICDDLISTTIVACQAPIVFAPSMNEVMWTDKLVQRNVSILKEVGYYVLEPGEGFEVSTLEKGSKGGLPPIDALYLSLKVIYAAANQSKA